MDLTGDGIPDVISGSWPGELYLFRGVGKGLFAAGEPIKDRDGKAIKLGSASTVFAVDWDGDGKLDLLVGNIDGEVHLILNEGDAKQFAFGKPRKLEAAGKPIKVPHGDSHPVAADWDGDGKLDLLVGAGDGSVLWYRNIGTKQEPKLAAAQTLVPAGGYGSKAGKEKWGVRAKICVTDWNGDGRLDLLVGDFNMKEGAAPKLTEQDKAAQSKAEKQVAKLVEEYSQLLQEQEKLQKPAADETPAARGEREKKLKAVQERSQKLEEEITQLQQTTQKFRPKYEYLGNVWLFVRKPAPTSTRAP